MVGLDGHDIGCNIPTGVKIGGIGLVSLTFACIFGPLVIFSGLNPIAELNDVTGAQF